jgi:putative transposase
VERNPIRAGVCRIARRYKWSSAAAHCGERDTVELLNQAGWKEISKGLNWVEKLADELSDTDFHRVRSHLRTGRPLAADGWLSKLESILGRRLRPLPIGRPRKPVKKAGKEKRK